MIATWPTFAEKRELSCNIALYPGASGFSQRIRIALASGNGICYRRASVGSAAQWRWTHEIQNRGRARRDGVEMAKIMVVDDEAALARIVRDALTNEGHNVYMETDGLAALSRMVELKPDLVVSDVMMPGMGGASLLTAMRDNAYLNEVPCVVMSGLPEDAVSVACGGAYSAFLAKPFDLRDLVSVVGEILASQA